MKILKIALQNINSLKSTNPILIDFESDHFQDVGLYAITGSTGAGKTTILDAITIGLYHSVARFNKTKANLIDVVSYGADDAFVNITFLANNERYEAHWSVRLVSKNGKPLSNPNETVRLKNLSSGKIIADKKREVQAAVEEITLLTYDQFLRSVLLAQGEFAAFLSASPAQKGELLEQITGEEIYKKIGEAVNQKIYDESRLLKEVKAKINDVDLLTEETRESLFLEQKEIQENLNTQQLKVDRIRKILDWFKEEKTLLIDQKEIAKKEIVLTEKEKKNTSSLAALAAHERAMPFQNLLVEERRLRKDIDIRAEKTKQLQAESAQLKVRIVALENQLLEAKEKRSDHEKELEKWEPILSRVGELDILAIELKKDQRKEHETAEKITKDLAVIRSKEQEFVARKEKVTEDINRLKALLKTNEHVAKIDEERSALNRLLTERDSRYERTKLVTKQKATRTAQLNLLTTKLSELGDLLLPKTKELAAKTADLEKLSKQFEESNLKELLAANESLSASEQTYAKALDIAKLLNSSATKINTLKSTITEIETRIGDKEKELGAAQPQLKSADLAVRDAEKIVQLQQTVQSLAAEREKLKKGEPCALCGSKDHPLVDHYNAVVVDTALEELKIRKKNLLESQEKINQLKLKLTGFKTQLTERNNVLKEELTDFDHLKNQYKSCKVEYDWAEVGQLEKVLKQLKEKRLTTKQKVEEAQELQSEKEKLSNLIQVKKGDIEILTKRRTEAKAAFENQEKELAEINEELAQLQEQQRAAESGLKDQLMALKLNLPELGESQEFSREIDQLIEQFHSNQKALDRCSKDFDINEKDIDALKKRETDLKVELKRTNEQLLALNTKHGQNREERGALLPVEVSLEYKNQALKKALQASRVHQEEKADVLQKEKSKLQHCANEITIHGNEIKKATKELDQVNLAFQTKLSDSQFETFDEVQSALLMDEEANKYQQLKEALTAQKIELKTLKEKNEKGFERLLATKDPTWSAESAEKEYASLEEVRKTWHTRLGVIHEIFRKDLEIVNRNKGVVEEINRQEKVLKKWTDLMRLLGNSKHAFNTYVQRLTLKNLIALANVHLLKLNPRYSLRLNETYKPGEELNFVLIDHYQTNQTRLVDTSSGGEKFIISLALALGLSDLASHHVTIGSLFIDEGFGTLDNNTLEIVITTLETLKSQGKLIGIISHVENLKERIPVQIKVLKKSNGVSHVEIV
jgi:exonuclease SbcC